MKHLVGLTAICLMLSGCSSNEFVNDPMLVHRQIDITENKVPTFFNVGNNFELSSGDKIALEKLLKEAKSKGIENVGFMIISDVPVPEERAVAVSDSIKNTMIRSGFMLSRIVDSGVCVYKDAKKGIRVDILKYDIKGSDASLWDYSIGDSDQDKTLPKLNVANNYNLEEMIANKADLISPRKYRGQKTESAVKAMSSVYDTGGGSGGSSYSAGSAK